MNKKKFTDIITFVKSFIKLKYNYLKIDYNKTFVGCKFYKDKYYIFYITNKNSEMNLTYRENFTKENFIRVSLKKYNYKSLEQELTKIMNNTIKINNELLEPRKKLANMLVTDLDLEKKIKNNQNTQRKIDVYSKNTNNVNTVESENTLLVDSLKSIEETINNSKSTISIEPKVIELLFSNQDFSETNLSARTVNALEQKGIKNQSKLFNKITGNNGLNELEIGKKGKEEIAELKRNVFDKCFNPKNNTEILFYFLKNTSGYEEISVINLKNRIKNLDIYEENKFIENINELRKTERILFTMNGVKVKPIKLLDSIQSLKENTKEIVLERLKGKTLQQIGEEKGMTRERIRQVITKSVNSFPTLEEDKYKNVFEEYNFNEDDFTRIFNESSVTFYYLKEKYEVGNKSLKEGLNDYYFNDEQKNKIKEIFKITNIFNEDVVINRSNIISSLIKEYAKEKIGVEKFTEIYNSFCSNHKDYKLELLSDRNIEGMVARSGIAIFGYGRSFRYYNFDDIIGTDDYITLKKMFEEFEKGYYSTLLIFENNKDLMNNLKIKNEYELHNLSKRMFENIKELSFDRMPNFSKNGINKESFIEQKMKELSPISLNEFVEMMESDYGHKIGTLTSYIQTTFSHFIDNNTIKCDLKKLNDSDFIKIKTKLTQPIYSIESLKEIFETENINNSEDYINSYNVNKLGYKIRSSYILCESINSIEEYIKKLVDENDFIQKTNFLNNSTYGAAMKKAEKNFDIAHISKDEYITITKLLKIGINKNDFKKFCIDVYESFENEKYFSLNNVREIIDIGKLDDLGFDDIFLENIINTIEGIECIKIANNKVFSFSKDRIDSKIFISDCVGTRNSIFLSDLQDEIKKNYGIQMEEDKIKNIILETELYYSDNLNKIFQSKEQYYEEVYSYEQ